MCKSVARPIRYTSGPRAGSCGKNNGNRRAMSMSAICGWFAIDTSSPVEQIEAMTRALPCPDTAHTIHQAAPDRALAAASASFFLVCVLWFVCDGAPYFNAPDLRALAERDGIAAAIAEGYRRRGRECLAEIQGAFAIALLDTVAPRARLQRPRLREQRARWRRASRRRGRDRPPVCLRLSLFPHGAEPAHDPPRRGKAPAGAIRGLRERPARERLLLAHALRRRRRDEGAARRGISRTAARRCAPHACASPPQAGQLFERRHRQLDARGPRHRTHGHARRNLFDRFRCAGL